MRETQISLPELALVAGTRAALGAGLGLLLADRLAPDQRRAVGWTLFLFGAISTIPLAIEVLGHRVAAAEESPWPHSQPASRMPPAADRPAPIGVTEGVW